MYEEDPTDSVEPEALASPGVVQAPLANGSTLAGRYEIRRVLGSGGYSHVYAAWDHTLGREIAIKVLRAERISEVGLKRLRREVLVAQKTRNPNLLRIFDFAQDGENVFLTTRGKGLGEEAARVSAALSR